MSKIIDTFAANADPANNFQLSHLMSPQLIAYIEDTKKHDSGILYFIGESKSPHDINPQLEADILTTKYTSPELYSFMGQGRSLRVECALERVHDNRFVKGDCDYPTFGDY